MDKEMKRNRAFPFAKTKGERKRGEVFQLIIHRGSFSRKATGGVNKKRKMDRKRVKGGSEEGKE